MYPLTGRFVRKALMTTSAVSGSRRQIHWSPVQGE
jgi:hypothetical protein